MVVMARIHSVKHVLDAEGVVTEAGSVVTIAASAPVRADPFVPGDVLIGSSVNNIFLSIYMIGASGQPFDGTTNWYINKRRQGQTANFPLAGATGASKVRNQIFHEEKGVPGSGDGTPMVFRGVIRVPKIYRRMREGDGIDIRLATTVAASDATFCVKAIYKEFY